jgi:methyl-accepting chemotaxis protein
VADRELLHNLHLKADRLLAVQAEHTQKLADLNESVSALAAGLSDGVLPQLQDHKQMLQDILEAATDEPESGGVSDLIRQLMALMREQNGQLHEVATALQRLPSAIERAAIDGVRLAMGDGVDARA